MTKIKLTFLSIMILGLQTSFAGFYLKPNAGVFIPITSNPTTQASIGATAGYQFIKLFAVEASYSRFIEHDNAPAADSYRATGIVRVPTGIFAPYASVGTGLINYDLSGADSDYFTTIGAGVQILKLFKVSANVGVEYGFVEGGKDFFEPRASVGLHF